MTERNFNFTFKQYEALEELNTSQRELVVAARKATAGAYAPYSNFFVSAVALLNDGTTVSGTNQENASYPVGICAERTLLATIGNLYASHKIISLAISYHNKNRADSNEPVAPCGMCRQALMEWRQRQESSFNIFLCGQTGPIIEIKSIEDLLPLSFVGDILK